MTWENDAPVAVDLYYDPVVDEHVGRGPMGLIAPAWYFAPQRPEVARMGWQTLATVAGVLGDGPITGVEDPRSSTLLLQLSGEFADAETKARIWEAADEHIEPTWDHATGEFTLGFKLGEPHPRGQYNARAMAGWLATPGAWARIFNAPNLEKFDRPTIEGVDFPRVALSEARWDGEAMHLAAHPQNRDARGSTTTMRLTNVVSTEGWVMTGSDGKTVALQAKGDHVEVALEADDRVVVIRND